VSGKYKRTENGYFLDYSNKTPPLQPSPALITLADRTHPQWQCYEICPEFVPAPVEVGKIVRDGE